MTDLRDCWGDSPAVLVVDMTRSLADPSVDASYDVGVEAARRFQAVLDVARANDVPVLYSKGGMAYYTSTGADVADVERGGWAITNDLVEETSEEAELHHSITPLLEPRDDEPVIAKSAPSAFFGTMLETYLSALRIDTLVIGGMVTGGCVRATVTDAFSYGYPVVLPEECLADPRPENHEHHIRDMGRKYALVVSADQVVDALENGVGRDPA